MRVLRVVVKGPSRLRAWFSDGFTGELDLAPSFLPNDPLSDPAVFAHATCSGLSVEWPGGIDFCPDSLRLWCEAGRVLPMENPHAQLA